VNGGGVRLFVLSGGSRADRQERGPHLANLAHHFMQRMRQGLLLRGI
jgi:hypothetical protein